ncbi:hypothetical protein ACNQGM_07995 [Flavobacterium sp. LB2R40]
MDKDEIEKLEAFKRLTSSCLNTLKPVEGKSGIHTAKIRVYDYYELAAIIRNLLKLCIVALYQDGAEVPITIKNFDNRSTNASAESFNAKIKAFRSRFRDVRNVEFFLFRLTNIYA